MNEIEFTTANDVFGRDPTEVEIWGSNQSEQNGFTKIANVPLTRVKERFTPYGDGFTNGTANKYYRVVITGIDRANANSYQFAEVDFYSNPDEGETPQQDNTGTGDSSGSDHAKSDNHPQQDNTGTGDSSGSDHAKSDNHPLLLCGQAPCVCRPLDAGITYDGLSLPPELHTADWLPDCGRTVLPNGVPLIGEEGYNALSLAEQAEINDAHDFSQNISDKFREARNLCSPQSIYRQNCPSPTTLDSCFALSQMPNKSSMISGFEMGYWSTLGAKCAEAIPLCIKESNPSPSFNQLAVSANDFTQEALSSVQDQLGPYTTMVDGKKVIHDPTKAGKALSNSITAFQMGLVIASGGSEKDKIGGVLEVACGSVLTAGCGTLVTLAGGGSVADVAVSAGKEIVSLIFPQILAAEMGFGLILSLADYLEQVKLCNAAVGADNDAGRQSDELGRLSLEDYSAESLQHLGKHFREAREFEIAYQQQQWSKNPDDIAKCKGVPLDKQSMDQSHLWTVEASWLQWCKDKQTEWGMSPLPILVPQQAECTADEGVTVDGELICAPILQTEYYQCIKSAGGTDYSKWNKCSGKDGDPLGASPPEAPENVAWYASFKDSQSEAGDQQDTQTSEQKRQQRQTSQDEEVYPEPEHVRGSYAHLTQAEWGNRFMSMPQTGRASNRDKVECCMISHYGATATDLSKVTDHDEGADGTYEFTKFNGQKGCESVEECECNPIHVQQHHPDIWGDDMRTGGLCLTRLQDDADYQAQLEAAANYQAQQEAAK